MNKERITMFVGHVSMSIVEAMGKIDVNANGILFLVDENNHLSGCITDGDIRRWLIKTGDLSAPVKDAMTEFPRYLFEEEKSQAEKMMREEHITALPILNSNRCIVDLILLREMSTKVKPKEKGDLSGIPVIIMAGGKGTRLYPFTKILPKPLIPIGETPIVERIINCFVEYGINKYFMTVNYKKSMIKSYFADVEHEYQIQYVEEERPLGTGGSIKLIQEQFNQPIIVTNCDALILTDYYDLYNYHIKSNNDITIVTALKNIVVPYGVLHSKGNGEILGIEEKPKQSYFINTGMYVINPETIKHIPENTVFHMTHLVEEVMKAGGKVGMYPVSEDSFLDMGEFDEMHRMEEKLNIGMD